MTILYNEDYFEHGCEKGISLYDNYRWLPELTIPLCSSIIKYMDIKSNQTLLDYGCSKGFMVKAMIELGIDTYGWDISEYAINNCHPDVKSRVKLINKNEYSKDRWYDWVLAKDVLEHMEISELRDFLHSIPSGRGYFIIPLGIGGKYNDPRNNFDITHKLAFPAWWWALEFNKTNWSVIKYSEKVEGIKQTWPTHDAYGHFVCMRLDETK
jgi:SAM-dependent methyltransferase